MNKNQNENRYRFFMFNNKCYGVGTIFKFTQQYIDKRKLKYHYGKLTDANYLTNWVVVKTGDKNCLNKIGFGILDEDLTEIIEEIIAPVEAIYTNPKDKEFAYRDFEISGMIEAWMIYLFFMGISSIFVCNVGLWIIISIVFFTWRYTEKSSYGYK